jgi:hypothetical protein
MRHPLAIGDRVAYSVVWLRAVGCTTGNLPFARGVITGFKDVGTTRLAEIDWNDPQIPGRVNVVNLVRVKDIPTEAS